MLFENFRVQRISGSERKGWIYLLSYDVCVGVFSFSLIRYQKLVQLVLLEGHFSIFITVFFRYPGKTTDKLRKCVKFLMVPTSGFYYILISFLSS